MIGIRFLMGPSRIVPDHRDRVRIALSIGAQGIQCIVDKLELQRAAKKQARHQKIDRRYQLKNKRSVCSNSTTEPGISGSVSPNHPRCAIGCLGFYAGVVFSSTLKEKGYRGLIFH
jgi:hypothetical protein